MRRGDVIWADLGPAGTRPVLVLTRDAAIRFLNSVTVAPITRTVREIDTAVTLTPDEDGMPERCSVTLDNVQTFPKEDLLEPLATLGADRMNQVCEALHVALALEW